MIVRVAAVVVVVDIVRVVVAAVTVAAVTAAAAAAGRNDGNDIYSALQRARVACRRRCKETERERESVSV